MRKFLLLGAVLSLGLSFAPSSAEAGNGCAAVGGELDAAISCTYTADGPATFVAATPNAWSVVAQRGDESVPLGGSGSASFPGSGPIASQAGDIVTVTMGPDCVPATPVCGSIGIVAVYETA